MDLVAFRYEKIEGALKCNEYNSNSFKSLSLTIYEEYYVQWGQ